MRTARSGARRSAWGLEIDVAAARGALAAAAGRTARLLREAGDGSVPVAGSEWTVGEVGAHLAVGLRVFTQAVRGDAAGVHRHIPDSARFRERLTGFTSSTLALEPRRAPGALADRIDELVEEFLDATAQLPPGTSVPTPWYGPDASLGLPAATALLVGEQLVHGYDVAHSLGRPWPISADDARLVLRAATSMMPLLLDPATASGVRATYGVRVRGGPRFVLRVDAGRATVLPTGAMPVDCHVSAEPVSMVLVAYGRTSQWGPIARGRLVAWGRRPWLGLEFKRLFCNP